MGELQERITSTKSRSITSVQAIYVPADDYTDPAPPRPLPTWMPAVLSRAIWPNWVSIRPLTRWLLPRGSSTPEYVGRGALRRRAGGEADASALQGPPGHHSHLGIDELSEEDKRTVARAPERFRAFLSRPIYVAERFTGSRVNS